METITSIYGRDSNHPYATRAWTASLPSSHPPQLQLAATMALGHGRDGFRTHLAHFCPPGNPTTTFPRELVLWDFASTSPAWL